TSHGAVAGVVGSHDDVAKPFRRRLDRFYGNLTTGGGIKNIHDRPRSGVRKVGRQIESVALFVICAANHTGNYRADGQRGGRDLRERKLAEYGRTDDRRGGPKHSNNIDVAVIGKQGRLRSPYRRSPPKRSLDGPPATVGSNWTRPSAVTLF